MRQEWTALKPPKKSLAWCDEVKVKNQRGFYRKLMESLALEAEEAKQLRNMRHNNQNAADKTGGRRESAV